MILPDDISTALTPAEAAELYELAENKTVLEVGAWHGFSTIMLAQQAEHVHSVDWHQGDAHTGGAQTLFPFMMNIDRYKVRDKVTAHIGLIEHVAPILRDRMFDLIFLDAFHSLEAVLRDINLLVPLAKPGGRMAFHDYGLPKFGVTEAVDQFRPVDRLVGTLAVVTV